MCEYTLFLIYKINYSVKLILFLYISNLFSYRKNLMIIIIMEPINICVIFCE